MYTQTINSSEKLNVFFGAITILKDNDEKERNILDFIMDEAEEEDLDDPYEQIIKRHEEFRKEILNLLNIRGDISNIEDLYEVNPEILNMNPFIFTLRVPYSTQKSLYRDYLSYEPPSKSETFHIVYNGLIIFIASISAIDETPYGVYDARDRVIEILSEKFNTTTIPPCLSHQSFNFVSHELDEDIKDTRLFPTEEETKLREIYQRLYGVINRGLIEFYNNNNIAKIINEETVNIIKKQKEIADYMNDYLKFTYWDYLKKREIINKVKNELFRLLTMISFYQLRIGRYRKSVKRIERERQNITFDILMKQIMLPEEIQLNKFDMGSMLSLMNNIRCEIDSYQTNNVSLISALIGAIIGSIITIISQIF